MIMRERLVLFYLMLGVLLLIAAACQRNQPIEYVKYENDAAVPRISAEDAKKELDAGNAIFVDSRGDAAFEQEHLPGAMAIQFGSSEDKFSSLPKGKKIIVYCS